MADLFEYQVNRYYDTRSSPDFNCKSQKRFNKDDPRDQQRALKAFKDLIGASMDYKLKDKSCCLDDNFLSRFLYARKFDCDEAFALLLNYLTFKEQNKLLLQKINIFDENIQLALKDGNPAILHERDRRGRKVITFTAANWDPAKYSLIDVFRALLLSLDKLLENLQNQALGFVIIVDWANFTYRQSGHLTPKILKLMIEGLQDCTPAKFKGIHFISQPWYVEMALRFIKPFLKDKIKERFIIHGTNLTSLHQLVAKDILPPDLGGEGPSINTLDWYHYLLESSQLDSHQAPETRKSYRLIEQAIYTQTPPNQSPRTTIKKDICDTTNKEPIIAEEDFITLNPTSRHLNGCVEEATIIS